MNNEFRITNSQRNKKFTVKDVEVIIAELSDKVTRLQKDIRALKQSESSFEIDTLKNSINKYEKKVERLNLQDEQQQQQQDQHANDRANEGSQNEEQKVVEFTVIDDKTTPGRRREEESRESTKNFSHETLSNSHQALSCLLDTITTIQQQQQRKLELFNVKQQRKNRTNDCSDEYDQLLCQNNDFKEKRRIIRKRISRGIQCDQIDNINKYQIFLQCFQPQNEQQASLIKDVSSQYKNDRNRQEQYQNSRSKINQDHPNQDLNKNRYEKKLKNSGTIENKVEDDEKRYAGVVVKRNRVTNSSAIPHQRSEINEVKVKHDKRLDRTVDYKSKKTFNQIDDGKPQDQKSREPTSKSKSSHKKITNAADVNKEERNDETRKTSSVAASKREKNRKDINIEIKSNNKTKKETNKLQSTSDIKKSKSTSPETKNAKKSKMKIFTRENNSKIKTDSEETIKTTPKGENLKSVLRKDKNKKKTDSQVRISAPKKEKSKNENNSSDHQYLSIKRKLNDCANELNQLVGKVSDLFHKKDKKM